MPLDADESRELLEHYRISGIPTVMAFRGGRAVGRITGALGEVGYREMFASLAEGGEVRVSMAPFDRTLRLGAGFLLAAVGISTSSWLLVGLGGLVAFLGIYDRCPIWAAFTKIFQNG